MSKKNSAVPAQPEPAIKAERRITRSEHFVSLYTNDTQVQTTPWDIRLVFGQIDVPPTNESTVMEVTQVADVRMSPQHAKKIAIILQAQIQAYEAKVGPIPLPD